MDGRGRPAQSGPLDGNGRRSIYLNVRRNFLDPVLLAFDAPVPFSTMGRRNVSNVPAQALALLNDPLVISQARVWAERELAATCQSPRARIDRLYITAFGRPATDQEARASLAFIAAQTHTHEAETFHEPEARASESQQAHARNTASSSRNVSPDSRLSLREKTSLRGAKGDTDSQPTPKTRADTSLAAWADFCHVLLNVKTFIFID
jgi:hypothetical protein